MDEFEEQAQELAEAPGDSVEPTRTCGKDADPRQRAYDLPLHLTLAGEEVLAEAVNDFVDGVGIELGVLEMESRRQRREVAHDSEAVKASIQAYLGRLQFEANGFNEAEDGRTDGRRRLSWALILVGTPGIGVMVGYFPHSVWQTIAFLCFWFLLILGIILRWAS